MCEDEFKRTAATREGINMKAVCTTRRALKALLPIVLVAAALTFAAAAGAMTLSASTNGATITSDQEVYSPGQQVHLSGAGWQPGESVHLDVNDSVGSTWSWSDDVTADSAGAVSDSFSLPSTFVATYSITATGANSGIATGTFYDDTTVIAGPTTANVGDTRSYTATKQGGGCNTTAGSWSIQAGSASATIQPGATQTSASVKFNAAGTVTLVSTWTGTNNGGQSCIATGSLPITVSNPDTTAPSLSVTPTGANGAGWNNTSPVSLTITASDSGSGLAGTPACHDGSTTLTLTSVTTGTWSSSVSGDGTHSISCSVSDNAGNPATATDTVKIDTAKPSVAITSPADGSSTTATTVTVSGTDSDGTGSGVSTVTVTGTGATLGTGTFSLSNYGLSCGPNTITAVATDVAGNTQSASVTVTQTCDTTPPTVTVTVPTAPNGQGGWFNANDGAQTVNVSATDASGVTSLACTDGANSAIVGNQSSSGNTRTGSFQVSSNGTHSISCTATDAVGNSGAGAGSSNTGTVMIDTVAPTVTDGGAMPAQPNGSNGWYTSAVSNAFSATDNAGGSGLSTACSTAFPRNVSTETNQGSAVAVASGSCSDVAGNTTGGINSGSFKIDLAAPQQTSCESADGVWHADNVTLHCTYADAVSGPATQQVALSTNVASGSEDANAVASAGGANACDAAGNCAASPSDISGNKIDRKAPQQSGCDTADGTWHDDNVTLQCTYTDGGSGPASQKVDLKTAVAAGSDDSNAPASAGGVQACDAVGNCAASPSDISGNKIDRKAPQLAGCDSPDGQWHGSNVTLHCTYTDGGSGPASQTIDLKTAVADGSETATATASANGAQACDAVNNCAASPSDIAGNKIDRKAPTITDDGVQSGTAGTNGWYISAVMNRFSAADGGSGLSAACATAFPKNVSTEADEGTAVTVSSGTCTDAVGNAAAAISSGPFMVDLHDPTISCDSADSQWHSMNISIACTASDGVSGLAHATDASFTLSTSVGSGFETNNASTGTRDVSDAAGRVATAGPISGNKIDRKAPVISCGSADSDWHGTNQSVTCTATDGGSGLANPADSSFTVSTSVAAGDETNSAMTGSHLVADSVGNSDTAGSIGPFKVDRKAPTYSCDAAPTAWSAADITINCTAADGGSGLAPASDGSFSLSTNVPAGTETSSASTNSKTLTDAVGNTASAGPISGLNVDKKAPTITFTTRTQPNGNGWNKTDVTVNWSCSDSGSGVVHSTDAVTLSTEGANQSAKGTCTDNVGHTASDTQTGINIDETPPSVTYTGAPAPNAAGWYNTDVVATFTATDALSGFAGPSATKTDTSTTTGEGSAVTVGSPAFTDLADNTAKAGAATSDAYKIDKTKPVVSVTGVTNGAVYQLGSVPAAGCSTTDALSGVKTSASLTSSGGPVGSVTATCSGAQDNAGNTNSASVTYSVQYNWNGFFQPLNSDPTVCNVVKAGSAIPVKFSLTGYQGMSVIAPGYPTVGSGTCSGAALDPITDAETVTAGNSSLNYDATADQYIYVWKTDKSWVGQAKRFTIVLADGTTHYARFTFTK